MRSLIVAVVVLALLPSVSAAKGGGKGKKEEASKAWAYGSLAGEIGATTGQGLLLSGEIVGLGLGLEALGGAGISTAVFEGYLYDRGHASFAPVYLTWPLLRGNRARARLREDDKIYNPALWLQAGGSGWAEGGQAYLRVSVTGMVLAVPLMPAGVGVTVGALHDGATTAYLSLRVGGSGFAPL